MRVTLKITCLILSLTLFTISSCKGQHSNIPAKECIELNNKGLDLLMNYPMNGEQELDKAVDLFKQAITCDSTDWVFYNNLANAYEKKHNYNGELIELNKLLILNENYPMFIISKGMVFEKINKIDSANKMYDFANVEFKKRLAKNPEDVGLIQGVIQLKAITLGKDSAIKEIDNQIKLHPNLSSKLSYEYEYYKYFNRHNYIYGLPTEIDSSK